MVAGSVRFNRWLQYMVCGKWYVVCDWWFVDKVKGISFPK